MISLYCSAYHPSHVSFQKRSYHVSLSFRGKCHHGWLRWLQIGLRHNQIYMWGTDSEKQWIVGNIAVWWYFIWPMSAYFQNGRRRGQRPQAEERPGGASWSYDGADNKDNLLLAAVGPTLSHMIILARKCHLIPRLPLIWHLRVPGPT